MQNIGLRLNNVLFSIILNFGNINHTNQLTRIYHPRNCTVWCTAFGNCIQEANISILPNTPKHNPIKLITSHSRVLKEYGCNISRNDKPNSMSGCNHFPWQGFWEKKNVRLLTVNGFNDIAYNKSMLAGWHILCDVMHSIARGMDAK